jgi:hypothetical protein
MISKAATLLLVSSCLVISSLASADDVIDAQAASLVKVVTVTYDVEKVDANTNMLHVMALGEFPNACLAPQADAELAAAVQLSADKTTDTVSLLQLPNTRVCTAIEAPVQVMIHVAHIYYPTNGMNTPIPTVVVNGVKAAP